MSKQGDREIQLREMRERRLASVKPGPRETKSKTARITGARPARPTSHRVGSAMPENSGLGGAGHPASPITNPVAPTKKKRAPRGTFDRKAYQRELMRKRRAEAKKNG